MTVIVTVRVTVMVTAVTAVAVTLTVTVALTVMVIVCCWSLSSSRTPWMLRMRSGAVTGMTSTAIVFG